MVKRRYPIGMQSFADIREGGYVYVDKTAYIGRLVDEGKYYFLSRPRRFGKSLLLSTMEAYFLGRKELFSGLDIDRPEEPWHPAPVLHLDLNAKIYDTDSALHTFLDDQLRSWERIYGIVPDIPDTDLRFKHVITGAYETTGRKVVVLIDEYDKPLLENLFNQKRLDSFRNELRGFYSVLKSCDHYIRFAFLTGVTKFGQLSVFSGLNNLNDISLDLEYNAICGISESELADGFEMETRTLSRRFGVSEEDIRERLRVNYDGYRFTGWTTEGVYNPFSIFNVFQKMDFGMYWFATGTPKMLVDILRQTRFDLSELEGAERSQMDLMGIEPVFTDPIPVMYQSGYLTIKGYNREEQTYRLGFPNLEVEKGFLEALLPLYINPEIPRKDMNIFLFIKALREGDVDGFMRLLACFMEGIPYIHGGSRIREGRFHDVVFIIARLMGLNVETELRTLRGSIDLTVKTDRYIYIIEFKVDRSPDVALSQIEEMGYDRQFLTDGRTLIRVGVEFSTRLRNIKSWKYI